MVNDNLQFKTELEVKIWNGVQPFLIQGRPGWDLPHTLAATYWLHRLLEKENGDREILIPAILVHDVGWSALKFDNNRISIAQNKNNHMQEGVKIARPILEKAGVPLINIEKF